MYGAPNRMGLGMRPAPQGQGPSFGALAQQNQMQQQQPAGQKMTTVFVGSISGGITDAFLNQLLGACGPVRSFKRLITPAGKPQGFGFAEFEDPDSVARAIDLLNGIELPATEEGCANKQLLVKADERTKTFLQFHQANRMKTDCHLHDHLQSDDARLEQARKDIGNIVKTLRDQTSDAQNGGGDGERYVIPPHLHDLHEADLPENQRGLVISEIAQFRERAAKKERDKQREVLQQAWSMAKPAPQPQTPTQPRGGWGPQRSQTPQHSQTPPTRSASQSFDRPSSVAGFVREAETPKVPEKTDEELERERKDQRAREEHDSFRDRERRYEGRERRKMTDLEREVTRERQIRDAEERDRQEIRERLHVWDDDESDELFYTDRARWRAQRARVLLSEREADERSRDMEQRQAEELRKASEAFLAQQMEEMQALAEEQRKAGMLLDDTAPIKLTVATTKHADVDVKKEGASGLVQAFAADDDEEIVKKRKMPLVKLDFSALDSEEKMRERLEKIRESIPRDKEPLFKARNVIDKKIEPLTRRKMEKYIGEVDEELLMFVIEHLKDKKGPQKLLEGLEPVLMEEAEEFVIALWRQVIFESMAYGEGMHTGELLAD
ncbi:hypothetical protein AURDEDRAFT_121442 [Auricularia subglabra TFB-10046 SS5]|nr:hypothetical protein AURDEDRAFT_121442 [Auricularia subglabra TFB-10046 SS5]